jgi:two-component system sensor histidine kinase PilS (NtrC family)
MEAFDPRQGLNWLVRVRFIAITFLLVTQPIVMRLTDAPTPLTWWVATMVLWYVLALFLALLLSIWSEYRAQAYLHIIVDAVMVTSVVHLSGGTESYYAFLYPLLIIVAAIFLPRWSAYLVASLSFILFGGILELAYREAIPAFWRYWPDVRVMQATTFTNLAAFLAMAYLSSTLVELLRRTGTKLTQTSGQLETLQAFNQNVLDSIEAGVLTTDLEGRIQLLNRAGESILGRRLADSQGLNLATTLPGLAAAAGAPAGMEVTLQTPAGKEKILGVSVSPLRSNEGDPIGSVYVIQDLTEIKRLERDLRLQDRMAALGRMAGAIAHEIRNPLSAIAGSVQVFGRHGELSEDQKRLVEIVRKESERLDRILAQFLSYSRERKYEYENTDLGALIEETLTLMRHRPDAARWQMESRLPPGPFLAHVDVDSVKQVFWNLCDNALKAMPEGGKLTVDAAVNGAVAVIRFRDTGQGISQAEKIFEPFQTGFASGAGLGLAIVYQIVTAHQGSIRASSPPEGGSLFTLTLPLATQAAPSLASPSVAALS